MTAKPREFVWYSPEWDEIRIATKDSGFLFKDNIGAYHFCYNLGNVNDESRQPFQTSAFYLIGEL